ncbi:ABC transporter ATP-binding protein [Paenibacillus sp. PAMC21692]|uniref:ABC transporter ATP-binding protein n=1 Tax=Paenibacillus sp. PAMC21692 TaxID=2762320 RepID=UPI00164DF7E4|nr:ABC transporter ATP-binding protein [Paenibacillus sp. PAMC21692]QNK56429.1 ABC transporter ATP-binding protein [Paenibacillus sp. PAMC21692]
MSSNSSGSQGQGGASEAKVPPAIPGIGRPGAGGAGRKPVKPKQMRATMLRLWRYFGSERKRLIVIFAFVIATSLLAVAAPYLIGSAIDAMSAADDGGVDFGLLEIILLVLVAAYVSEGALSFLQSWLMAGLSQRVVKQLRGSLFGKLQKLPLRFFDSRSHGELMSRVTNDIDNVSNTVSQSTVQLMSGFIGIVGSLVMMLVLSPLLTLATLITVPLVYLLAKFVTSRTGVLFKEQQAQLGKLNGHIEETITGLQVVKAFNHEAKSIQQFEEVNGKLLQVSLKAQIWSGFLMPLLGVINNIGIATIAIVGGVMAVNGHLSVGLIASFVGYSRQFVRPLNEMAQIYNVLLSGVAGAERVFEVLDEKEEEPDAPGAIVLSNPKGHVVFENVNFGYRQDVPILNNVSFDSPKESSTALVGPTGAGKTTIVNLLTRFYDVTGGRILIDGRDIRDYTRESLRQCFGIVLQDTYLFSGTIRDNILYGKPDATEEEMLQAARMANADTFIRRLPHGYGTELTENGGNLSQGQRQLLAIARVILAKPSILILDEATSSIDTRTELHIQEALLKVMKGRTTFIIAHRLNTIRDADAIMVIDRGKLQEKGTHDALMERRGVYYGMFDQQFKNVQT